MEIEQLQRDMNRLSRVLRRLTFPHLVDRTEEEKRALAERIAQFNPRDGPVNAPEDIAQRPDIVERARRLIAGGQLAPLLSDDDTDFLDDQPSEICCICYEVPKDRRIGYNFVQCSENRTNHLICTRCLLRTSIRTPEKVNWDQMSFHCMYCNGFSPFRYVAPTVDGVFETQEPHWDVEFRRDAPVTVTRTRKAKASRRTGTPTVTEPPRSTEDADAQRYAAEFLEQLRPDLREFVTEHHLAIPSIIPADIFNEAIDSSDLYDTDVGLSRFREVMQRFV